jgi:hypothetical protein
MNLSAQYVTTTMGVVGHCAASDFCRFKYAYSYSDRCLNIINCIMSIAVPISCCILMRMVGNPALERPSFSSKEAHETKKYGAAAASTDLGATANG